MKKLLWLMYRSFQMGLKYLRFVPPTGLTMTHWLFLRLVCVLKGHDDIDIFWQIQQGGNGKRKYCNRCGRGLNESSSDYYYSIMFDRAFDTDVKRYVKLLGMREYHLIGLPSGKPGGRYVIARQKQSGTEEVER